MVLKTGCFPHICRHIVIFDFAKENPFSLLCAATRRSSGPPRSFNVNDINKKSDNKNEPNITGKMEMMFKIELNITK